MPSAIKVAVLVCLAGDGAAGRDGGAALGRWGESALAALELLTVRDPEAKKGKGRRWPQWPDADAGGAPDPRGGRSRATAPG